jgi:GTP cyclohydrolase I (EC 3.5.4.16)
LKNITKRLQIQERLTKNIADELYSQGVKGVVVFADAEHLCMRMRGVRNEATLSSFAFRGIYENKEEKEGIMTLIRKRASNSSF